MKKAKEYAKEIIEVYISGNEDDALIKSAQTIKDLFDETEFILKERNATQYCAILAVLKEQHLKWVAISKRVNSELNLLNKNAFLDVIKEKMTMIYPNLLQFINK